MQPIVDTFCQITIYRSNIPGDQVFSLNTFKVLVLNQAGNPLQRMPLHLLRNLHERTNITDPHPSRQKKYRK